LCRTVIACPTWRPNRPKYAKSRNDLLFIKSQAGRKVPSGGANFFEKTV
jgi:hypothetical protein